MDISTLALLVLVLAVVVVIVVVATRASRRASMPESAPATLATPRSGGAAVMLTLGVLALIAGVVVGFIPFGGCPTLFGYLSLDALSRSLFNFVGGSCSPALAAGGVITGLLVVAGVILVIAGFVRLSRASAVRGALLATSYLSTATAVPVAAAAAAPTAPAPAAIPAGWFPVPERPGVQRWWDGAAWTDHFHDPAAPDA